MPATDVHSWNSMHASQGAAYPDFSDTPEGGEIPGQVSSRMRSIGNCVRIGKAPWLRAFLAVAYSFGFRSGELLKLRRDR